MKKTHLWLIACAAITLASCSESSNKTIEYRGQLGDPCDEISLCDTGFVCIDNLCADQQSAGKCTSDNDCTNATCQNNACVPNIQIDCKNGTWSTNRCLCSVGYKTDNTGACTICADGYKSENNTCVKDEGSNPNPNPNECKATFYYTNADTNTETGGSSNFDVYLMSDLNNWNTETLDPNYKMSYRGNGVHAISIDVTPNQEFVYKYYVSGWKNTETGSDDGWKLDSALAITDDGQNNKVTITACGMEFGDKSALPSVDTDCGHGSKSGDSCQCNEGYKTDQSGKCNECADGYQFNENNVCTKPNPGTDPTGDCKFTFFYSNQWTSISSGGSKDFDVYLMSELSWSTEPLDSNYKMERIGGGVHKITLNLTEGQEFAYKYYVSGWFNTQENKDEGWQLDSANEWIDGDNSKVKIVCGGKIGNEQGYVPPAFDCVNGTYADDKCTCNDGYKLDDTGACTLCTDGYEFKDGKCSKIPESTECLTTFKYFNQWTSKASGGTADYDVYIAGSFNNWLKKNPDDKDLSLDLYADYKMTSNGNGAHTISLKLDLGDYPYKFYVNGWFNKEKNEDEGWKADPANKETQGENSLAKITQCGMTFGADTGYVEQNPDPNPNPNPDPIITGKISLSAQPKVNSKTITFSVTLDDSVTEADLKVTGGSGKATINGKTVTDTVTENNKYTYTVSDGKGNELYVPVWVEDKDFQWKDALLYFAFTDRFADGDKNNNSPSTDASHNGTSDARWMGGDYKGMLAKVEEGYFDKLGVNTLWISSVSQNTQGISWGSGNDAQHSYSAYHSYWPIATFFTEENKDTEFKDIAPIEPHFGTMDDLKALVDACHKRGMRVLVDFAANHVHIDSPIYKNHKDWFNGDKDSAWLCDDNNGWDNASETCWFTRDLPDINYNNVEARNLMIKHAIWLIKQTGIDGFRVDAVKHMSIQLIKDLRAAVDKLFSNTGIMFYMVGETFTSNKNLLNQYIGDDLLHAQFDFPLYYALQDVLIHGSMYNVFSQDTSYKNGKKVFNSDLMGTFMGNHDVARAVSVAAKQNTNKWGTNNVVTDWIPYFRVKQAWTILLTNPGVPLIYYGDEYGMTGANDPDNRRMMAFGDDLNDQQKGTLSYVQLLGRIRAQHSAITRGSREDLDATAQKWCYKLSDGSETIIVGVASNEASGTCNLKGSYKLQNLLDETEKEFTTSTLDFGSNKFQVYLVK